VVKQGEILCVIETDKATFEVESPEDGTLLETFFEEGADVPVLTNIAVIGRSGDSYDELRPALTGPAAGSSKPGLVDEAVSSSGAVAAEPGGAHVSADGAGLPTRQDDTGDMAGVPLQGQSLSLPGAGQGIRLEHGGGIRIPVSQRARLLAERQGIPIESIRGTGPGGRIIERDVREMMSGREPLSPAARERAASSEGTVPIKGSGIGGRVLGADIPMEADELISVKSDPDDSITEVPITGIRRIIAGRMLASIQSTAQLTLNTTAPASGLLNLRKKLKDSPDEYGLKDVTLNALILHAVSRTLPYYEDVNALYVGEKLLQYDNVHLAFAVDTLKGLIVPVIKNAHQLTLKQIADESKRLTDACQEGKVNPDELTGGTFTVTNLGALGIDHFTPVLNTPQVAILGVGGISLKPVDVNGEIEFQKHIALSLTIDHQVVDGAPAARFLRELCQGLENIEMMLAF
jgi:pyruvate dehydrogenase E2 component (dihydrolipoamide acetyltransferase)